MSSLLQLRNDIQILKKIRNECKLITKESTKASNWGVSLFDSGRGAQILTANQF